MKSSLFYSITSLLLILLLSGCAPELAQTKYGPEESQWKNYISKSYDQWEPPATPPPLSSDDTNIAPISTIEIVPEPAGMDSTEGLISIDSIKEHTFVNLPEKGVDIKLAPALTKDTSYTVKKGDTLWTISKKFYNNGREWKTIQDANIDVLPSADNLKAGMNLKIPANK